VRRGLLGAVAQGPDLVSIIHSKMLSYPCYKAAKLKGWNSSASHATYVYNKGTIICILFCAYSEILLQSVTNPRVSIGQLKCDE
jgi:hypothetical protein